MGPTLSMFQASAPPGEPTLASLEYRILMDTTMSSWDKQQAIQALEADAGNVPKSTPLRIIAPRIGGGLLGYLIGKYFGMSLPGQLLATMAGYGIGKVVSDFYEGVANPGINMRRLG